MGKIIVAAAIILMAHIPNVWGQGMTMPLLGVIDCATIDAKLQNSNWQLMFGEYIRAIIFGLNYNAANNKKYEMDGETTDKLFDKVRTNCRNQPEGTMLAAVMAAVRSLPLTNTSSVYGLGAMTCKEIQELDKDISEPILQAWIVAGMFGLQVSAPTGQSRDLETMELTNEEKNVSSYCKDKPDELFVNYIITSWKAFPLRGSRPTPPSAFERLNKR